MSSPSAKKFKSAGSTALALLESGRFSVVNFVVGEQEKIIRAHKLFLVRSPVFEAMFERWETEEHTTEISHLEVDVEPFKLFLKYLYSDQFYPVDILQVPDVLYLANFYDVPGLHKLCNNLIDMGIRQTNVAQIYQKAAKFKQEELMARIIKSMLRQAETFFQDVSFLDLDYDFLHKLIESDELEMKEVEVFRAVMRWAEHQCNQQDMISTVENKILILKDLIGQIRFPLFSEKEFTAELGHNHKGILKDSDMLEVHYYFQFSVEKFTEAFPDPKFVSRRRQGSNIYTVNLLRDGRGWLRISYQQSLDQSELERGELQSLKPGDDRTLECVSFFEFQVDKHIQITAIKLADYLDIDEHGDRDQDRNLEFCIQFILLDNKCDPKIVANFKAKYKTAPRILHLGNGVEITKGEKYLIKFSISPSMGAVLCGTIDEESCASIYYTCIPGNSDDRDLHYFVFFRFKKILEDSALRCAHKKKSVCISAYAIESIQFSV